MPVPPTPPRQPLTPPPSPSRQTAPRRAPGGTPILLGVGAAALGYLLARRAPETAEKIVEAEEKLLGTGSAAATGFTAARPATGAAAAPARRASPILDWLADEARARLGGALSGQPVTDRVAPGTQLAALARTTGRNLQKAAHDKMSPKPAAVEADDDDAAATPATQGRGAKEPTEIPAGGWKEIVKRTIAEIGRDRVVSFAGGITFFALLALFPAITALVSIYGLFANPADVANHLDLLSAFVPQGGLEIIGDQIGRIAGADSTALGFASMLSIGIALWSANGGMKALLDGLNVAYGEKETRSFIKLNLTSMGFTLGAMLLVIALIGVIAVLPALTKALPFSGLAEALMTWARWPFVFIAMMAVLAALYRFGPSREDARFAWVAPGTILAAVGLVAFSMAFSWYAANFANYNETYGSLGAVIGFMTWMWLSTTIVLVGAELNHEAERQTTRDTTTGTPKPIGARGAHGADTVA